MKTWQQICTLSLVHFMAFPEMQSGEGDFLESIDQVAERNFFGALEMGRVNDPHTRSQIKPQVQDYGLKIGYGAQPLILGDGLNLNHIDESQREQAVRRLKQAVDEACEMGADRFVLLSGKDPGPSLRNQAYSALEQSIVELGMYARSAGIRIVLETFDSTVDKMALVGPSLQAATFAREVRSRYSEFALIYDMGHMPLLDETPREALPILKDVLAEVHLGNCVKSPGLPSYGDKHPRFGCDGGVNDTAELVDFLRALFEIDYLKSSGDGQELPWVGFEMRPHGQETTEQILDNIEQTWQKAWDELCTGHLLN